MSQLLPDGAAVPAILVTEEFRLVPLGPEHNLADHAAWTSSIDHIRATPGFAGSAWPPPAGMSLDDNLADLRAHADDFARRAGFTYTVLEPATGDVIGCVYLYPAGDEDHDVEARSWVRADRAALDGRLAAAVARWLATEWPPLGRVRLHPR